MLAAHIDLPGQPGMVKVTPDQSAATVVASDGTGPVSEIGIALDLRKLSAPVVRSKFPLQGLATQFEVSPDGKTAMLLVRKGVGAASTWQMVVMSLADSKAVERSQTEISAEQFFSSTQIAIASNATAYAASLTDSKISLKKASGQEFSFIGQVLSHRSALKFSPDGQHLAFTQLSLGPPGSVGIADLTSSAPTVYSQAFAEYLDRYDCVLAVLNSGYVILNDARTPRLGIYAPEAGVPRVGALPGMSGCTDVQFEDPKSGMFTFATTTDIERIDVRDPRKPRAAGHWLIPANRTALALSGELLFTTRPDTKELEIYRLDQTRDTDDFDWHALENAYQQVMRDYRTSRKDAFNRRFDAFRALKNAGAEQAIERPVNGISREQAAEILNDYGDLAGVAGMDTGIEKALRRAIDLDPQRRVAYLNLADLRRARLDQSIGIENRQAVSNEVVNLYRKYLALGGKPSDRIDRFLIVASADKDTKPLCQAVAGYANNGTLKDLIIDKGLGIPLSGERVDLLSSTEGSAHVPTFYAFDSDTDFPVDITFEPSWAENLWGGDLLGFLMHDGMPQVIHYRDVQHPIHTVPLTSGPACEFDSSEGEFVSPRADEPALCEDLVAGSGPDSIEFNGPVMISRAAVEERYSETGADGTALVDFDNSGAPKKVVFLQMESGAGAGCDEQLFDVLSETGDHLAEGQDHDVIAALQSFDLHGRFPILPCGNAARFFVYHGKTYYESQPSKGATDSWTQYHHVTLAEHGKVKDVCGITYKSHIEVAEPSHTGESN